MKPAQLTPSAEGATEEGMCFACGRSNVHGLRLCFEVQPESRTATCDAVLPDHVAGWPGIAHGGIVSTVLDEAMVYAARAITRQAATAKLNVRFRKPVPTGVPIVVTGRVCDVFGRCITTKAYIERDGVRLAEADAVLLRLPEPFTDQSPTPTG